MKWKRAMLMTFVLILVLYAAWWFLPGQISQADFLGWLTPERPVWEGVITVWQVSGWRVASGTRDGVLQAAISEVEEAYRGVYFRMESLDASVCLDRMARGEYPDIISFPGGMGLPQQIDWLPLSPPVSLTAEADAARTDTCLPWMAMGQAWLVNAQLATDVQLDMAQLTQSDDFLVQIEQMTQTWTERRQTRSLLPITANTMAQAACQNQRLAIHTAQDDSVISDRTAFDLFAAGKALCILATPWEAAAMGRLSEQGKGFQTAAYTLSENMPMWMDFQWVSVQDPKQAGKAEILTALTDMLFSESIQKRITEVCGCLPVCSVEVEALTDIQQCVLSHSGDAYACRPESVLTAETVLAAMQGDTQAQSTLASAMIQIRWAR